MNSPNIDPQTMHALMAMIWILPIFGLVMIAIFLIPYWMIWKKAGFSPWLSLLMFLPLVNIVMLYVLAFSEWKVVPAQPAVYPPQYPPAYPRV